LICVEDLNLDSLELDGRFRGRARTTCSQTMNGRYVRALPVRESERSYDLAANATIRAAVLRQTAQRCSAKISISAEDLHKKIYQRPVRSLVIFVVDCSASMGDDGAQSRIRAAKGTILSILTKAYQKRFKVGLVSFYDESAETVLYPTSSLTMAQKSLHALPVGGATPFALGLMQGWQLIKAERRKDRQIRPLLVILSDGEANVAYDGRIPHHGIVDELLRIGGLIGRDGVSSLVIETRPLRKPSSTMRSLAQALGGNYYHFNTFKNSDLARAVTAFG
jgi:magnesium chelatase subunit D